MSKPKKCASCSLFLPLDKFYKTAQQKSGLSCYCKDCQKIKNKSKYDKKADDHQWRLQQTLKASKTRASKKGLEHTLTFEQLEQLYPPDNCCPIFGIELSWGLPKDTSPSLDRIDSSKGYTFDNCQIISNKANRIKSDATLEELLIIVDYLKEL